jgi:hypothetical protein
MWGKRENILVRASQVKQSCKKKTALNLNHEYGWALHRNDENIQNTWGGVVEKDHGINK